MTERDLIYEHVLSHLPAHQWEILLVCVTGRLSSEDATYSGSGNVYRLKYIILQSFSMMCGVSCVRRSGTACSRTHVVARSTRPAGPSDAPPSYDDVDNALWNRQITALFRQKMIAKIGEDTDETGYDGIIALTRKLNSMHAGTFSGREDRCVQLCPSYLQRASFSFATSRARTKAVGRPVRSNNSTHTTDAADPKETQEATIQILLTLFPAWLPSFFSVMFAKPFPEFSNKMNAWVTALTCQWLMGPNQVTDYERPDGTVATAQAVQVERYSLCLKYFSRHSSPNVGKNSTDNDDATCCPFNMFNRTLCYLVEIFEYLNRWRRTQHLVSAIT